MSLSFEIIEDPGIGGINLPVDSYLPVRIPAVSGELWLQFTDDVSNAPFKVSDVVPGQKLQIPLTGDRPIRLYLVSHDPTGRKTVIDLISAVTKEVAPNRELAIALIEQIGKSDLTSVQIGVKNFSTLTRFRKIQVSTDSDFSNPANIIETIRDFQNTIQVSKNIATITRTTNLSVEESKRIRVAHSSNGTTYGAWSNTLTVVFRNELLTGAPTLSSSFEPIAQIGPNWVFKFPDAVLNGYGATKVEYRMLRDTEHPTTTADITAVSTSIPLSSLPAHFWASGRVYLTSGETVGYDSIGGNSTVGWSLTGLHRAIDDPTILPVPLAAGSGVYFIEYQGSPDVNEYQVPRLEHDYVIHYRRTNAYRENNSTGQSGWAGLGTAIGTIVGTTIAAPLPPPSTVPPPPAQDPLIQPNNGRYKLLPDDLEY